VPPPGSRVAGCVACGRTTFAGEDSRLPLCERCALDPDERVRDRETGDLLVVAATRDRRADEVEIEAADCTVAAYPTNREYDPGEPVIEATYPGGERRYAYPLSRLDPRVGVGRVRSVGTMGSRPSAGQTTLVDGRNGLERAG
jgi:hypothetical protein